MKPEQYPLGVVIGKFYPPHCGHQFLIRTAINACRHVVVIVCGKPLDSIPGESRRQWLKELHPEAEVWLIDDRYDENDSAVWAANTIGWLGQAPDAVFTSEHYGDRYAGLMGAEHVLVDLDRTAVPISGTAVRADPWSHWKFIPPPVRGWFARRVCVLGAESTGTTTLAVDLAERLETIQVAEYGREYSAGKVANGDDIWQSEEFTAIAREQTRREDAAARICNRVLICDSNAFATKLWHRRYLARESPEVAEIAEAGKCDLYLLTGDEIPFVQDGLRDGEHIRHTMHDWFVRELSGQDVPWILLRGNHGDRMALALQEIRKLFPADANWWPVAVHGV